MTKMSRINTAVSRKREQRVLFMVVTMVVCYLLCWLPYGVMALLATFGRPGLVTPAASIVPSLLAKTSTVINPIIYIFMNKQVGANRKTVLTVNQSVYKDACLTFSEFRVTVRPLFPEYVLVVWPIACTLLVKLLFSQYLHLRLWKSCKTKPKPGHFSQFVNLDVFGKNMTYDSPIVYGYDMNIILNVICALVYLHANVSHAFIHLSHKYKCMQLQESTYFVCKPFYKNKCVELKMTFRVTSVWKND